MRDPTISWIGLPALLAGCSAAGPLPPPAAPDPAVESAVVEAVATPEIVPPEREPEPEGAAPATIESERALQLEGRIRTRAARDQRLHDLALPLLRSGVELCDVHHYEFGFRFATQERHATRDQRRAERAVMGIGARPTTWMVIAGSAAERAGMRRGDVLLSVGKVAAVSEGQSGSEAVFREMTQWRRGVPLPIRVERNGREIELAIVAERICGYAVSVAPDDEINAFATGNEIRVNQGLMRFAESDLELQAVIAHEIAHNSERHRAAKERNQVQNRVLGGLRGAVRDVAAAETEVIPEGAFSRVQEREADYLGMHYLARAGIDTRDAALIWRRMAAEGSGDVREYDQATHPSTPERFLLLEAARREIAAKREAGLPLLPNRDADGRLILPGIG